MNFIQWGRRYIDYRMGIIGCIVMAGLVFGINYSRTAQSLGSPDVLGSITAATKQGVFTFFFGGFIMRLSERLATEIQNQPLALISACILPSFVSLSLTFLVHSLKGTPEPLLSVIPTALLIIPGTAFWGFYQRRKLNTANKSISED